MRKYLPWKIKRNKISYWGYFVQINSSNSCSWKALFLRMKQVLKNRSVLWFSEATEWNFYGFKLGTWLIANISLYRLHNYGRCPYIWVALTLLRLTVDIDSSASHQCNKHHWGIRSLALSLHNLPYGSHMTSPYIWKGVWKSPKLTMLDMIGTFWGILNFPHAYMTKFCFSLSKTWFTLQ